MKENPFASLPQIEKLLSSPALEKWILRISRPLTAEICAEVIEEERNHIRKGEQPKDTNAIFQSIEKQCEMLYRMRVQKIVNATGIILHTNMGRSPIAPSVWSLAEEVNTGYSNLELNLATGKRGQRTGLLPRLLKTLTGGETSLIVNNNAAAVYLILSALAKDREVIVYRGEQVQIGGGFRIPDILAQTGAKLVEVGTTNITTAKDYINAVTPETAMVLLVHQSNFVIRGFSQKPDIKELIKGLPEEVIIAVDQGSGLTDETIEGEISVQSYIRAGADIVCFSGDKVLGGPQAGIITGNGKYIDICAKHPLMRVFRPGKTIYSLLEAFLIEKLNKTARGIAQKVLKIDMETLKKRGKKILKGIPKDQADIMPATLLAGGGSSPEKELPSQAVVLCSNESPGRIQNFFRMQDPPVIGTVQDNRFLLNIATILPEDETHVSFCIKKYFENGED